MLAGGSATNHRARDNPARLRLWDFTLHQVCGRSTKPGHNQSRLADRGTAQSDDPLVINHTTAEQFSDRNHVLITNVPNHPLQIHGVEVMNVSTWQSGRMRAGKLHFTQTIDIRKRYVPIPVRVHKLTVPRVSLDRCANRLKKPHLRPG